MMRSIHNLGAIMTRMALGGSQDPWGLSQQPEGSPKQETEVDHVVMETKAKIIEILEFIMNVRLDYRISSLLTIFKRDFDESNAGMEMNGEHGIATILFILISSLYKRYMTTRGNWLDSRRGRKVFLASAFSYFMSKQINFHLPYLSRSQALPVLLILAWFIAYVTYELK